MDISAAPYWYVRDGWLAAEQPTIGKGSLLGLIGASGWVGIGAIAARDGVRLETLSRSCLYGFSERDLEYSATFYRDIVRQQLQWLAFSNELLCVRALLRVADRLDNFMRLLLPLTQPHARGRLLPFRLTHARIAMAIGANRVTVTRLLGDWQRQGAIAFNRDRYPIFGVDFAMRLSE